MQGKGSRFLRIFLARTLHPDSTSDFEHMTCDRRENCNLFATDTADTAILELTGFKCFGLKPGCTLCGFCCGSIMLEVSKGGTEILFVLKRLAFTRPYLCKERAKPSDTGFQLRSQAESLLVKGFRSCDFRHSEKRAAVRMHLSPHSSATGTWS